MKNRQIMVTSFIAASLAMTAVFAGCDGGQLSGEQLSSAATSPQATVPQETEDLSLVEVDQETDRGFVPATNYMAHWYKEPEVPVNDGAKDTGNVYENDWIICSDGNSKFIVNGTNRMYLDENGQVLMAAEDLRLEDGTRVTVYWDKTEIEQQQALKTLASLYLAGERDPEPGTVLVNGKVAGVMVADESTLNAKEIFVDSIPLNFLLDVPDFTAEYVANGFGDTDMVCFHFLYGDGTEAIYELKCGTGMGAYRYIQDGKEYLVDPVVPGSKKDDLSTMKVSVETITNLFGWDVSVRAGMLIVTSDTKDAAVLRLWERPESESSEQSSQSSGGQTSQPSGGQTSQPSGQSSTPSGGGSSNTPSGGGSGGSKPPATDGTENGGFGYNPDNDGKDPTQGNPFA